MAYTTVELVRAVLRRDETKPAHTAAELDDEVIGQAIADAAARVDSALVNTYTVPFDPVPELIGQITRDIAAYLSDLVYRQTKDYSSERDPVYLRYTGAIKLLTDLGNNVITIPGAPTGSGLTTVNPYVGNLFVLEDFDLQSGPRPIHREGYPW